MKFNLILNKEEIKESLNESYSSTVELDHGKSFELEVSDSEFEPGDGYVLVGINPSESDDYIYLNLKFEAEEGNGYETSKELYDRDDHSYKIVLDGVYLDRDSFNYTITDNDDNTITKEEALEILQISNDDFDSLVNGAKDLAIKEAEDMIEGYIDGLDLDYDHWYDLEAEMEEDKMDFDEAYTVLDGLWRSDFYNGWKPERIKKYGDTTLAFDAWADDDTEAGKNIRIGSTEVFIYDGKKNPRVFFDFKEPDDIYDAYINGDAEFRLGDDTYESLKELEDRVYEDAFNTTDDFKYTLTTENEDDADFHEISKEEAIKLLNITSADFDNVAETAKILFAKELAEEVYSDLENYYTA